MASQLDKHDTAFFREFLSPAIADVGRGNQDALARAVREELSRIAFSDIADLVEFGPAGATIKDADAIPAGARRTIGKIETRYTKDGRPVVVVSTWPKVKALELLARHMGMLVDRMSFEVNEAKARQFARRVTEIVAKNVDDPEVLAAILEQLGKAAEGPEDVGDA